MLLFECKQVNLRMLLIGYIVSCMWVSLVVGCSLMGCAELNLLPDSLPRFDALAEGRGRSDVASC